MKSHNRAKSLVERFKNETNASGFWYEDQDLFIAWLGSIQAQAIASTFQSYRKWLASYVCELGFEGFGESIRSVAAKDLGRPVRKRVSISDSGMPVSAEDDVSNQELSQRVTPKDLASLAQMLLSQRGGKPRYRNGLLAFTWLQITAMTGVRPSEWSKALLLQDVVTEHGKVFEWVLEVVPAKKGGYHSSKKVGAKESDHRRRLVLKGWGSREIETLQLFMSQLPSGTSEFQRMQESIRQTLLLACKAVNMLPPIGLYTGRHLFASEVRRDSKYTRYQLAAMLGHSDTVNQKYYGDLKAKEGRQFEFSLPMPWPGVAEKVESVDRERYSLIYGSKNIVDMLVSTGKIPTL